MCCGWARDENHTVMAPTPRHHAACPSCRDGDIITISMSVSGAALSFATCHQCEAKWWFRDGEMVPLTSVLGMVGSR
jgi:DNA polymerase III alpha subunit (gram-positive type)